VPDRRSGTSHIPTKSVGKPGGMAPSESATTVENGRVRFSRVLNMWYVAVQRHSYRYNELVPCS
jgi:hypothetical protein